MARRLLYPRSQPRKLRRASERSRKRAAVDIVVFHPRELPIVLGALRALLPRPTPRQDHYLEVIAKLHGVTLDVKQLAPVPVAQLAAEIRDLHRRGRVVQIAVIMAMVDGQVMRAPAAAVATLANALGVSERAVDVLRRLVSRDALITRALMMRRIMVRFVRAAVREQGWRGIWQIVGGLWGLSRDAATAARFKSLARYPAGSLGRELYEHLTARKLLLPGERGAVPERMLFHDVGHLLSGYDTDPAGEIQQAAFQAGFFRKDGFAFLFFGVIQFHLGIKLTPVADSEVGYFDIDKVMVALARGARCRVDLSDRWSFWEHADRPLDQLRAEWGVPPLAKGRVHTPAAA